MCGINGIIDFSHTAVAPDRLQRMMAAMKHRGPDDEGWYQHNNVGFGHVRLSIIDLSADGQQPMHCGDDRYVIVFNGEIYNYIELREELSAHFQFRTKTDTEVLLNAYKHWGLDCLHHFNGMFAFAIHDKKTNSVVLARDRFGIKPVYYYQSEQQLLFASEIKAMLTQLNEVQPNNRIIYDFLVHDRVQHTNETFFQGIHKLQHGHYLVIENNTTQLKRWYDLRTAAKNSFTSSSAYADSLRGAINLRMRSDVAVGACLSGGLDSSSIVSLMLEQQENNQLHTFSAVYNKGEQGDESEFINCYAPLLKNMHFTKPELSALLENIDQYIETLEEPVPGLSEYAEFNVMALAKQHATVVLNGQGADEVLAGYHYFFGYYFRELLNRGKWLSFVREASQYWNKHKSLLPLKALLFFYLPRPLRERAARFNKSHLHPQLLRSCKSASPVLHEFYESKDLQAAFYQHIEYKLEHHLLWGDKSSMQHSIELRFPFLDHRHVESTLGLPSSYYLKNGETKRILREAMRTILPEKISNRQDKVGFETPTAKWMRNEAFFSFAHKLFTSEQFRNRSYFKPEVAIRMLKQHQQHQQDHAKEIWKMIHLELWFQHFIDKK
jgi:asparagine synthase (glutamine-hydrolysing)